MGPTSHADQGLVPVGRREEVAPRHLRVLAPAVLLAGFLWTALVVRWAGGADQASVQWLIGLGGAVLSLIAAMALLRELRARRDLVAQAVVEHDRATFLRARSHAAIYRAPVGVVVFDLDGTVEMVNDPVYELLGIAKGTSSPEVVDYFLPDDVERVRGHLARLIQGELELVEDEFRIRGPGGPLRWARISCSSILGPSGAPVAFVAHLQDIEAERAAQEALRSRSRWFSSIVERSSDLILLIDGDGTITWVSPSSRELLGVEPEHLLHQSVRRFVHAEDRARVQATMEAALATGSARVEFRIATGRGQERWLETTASNLLDDPDVGAVITISRDVTERHQAAQRLAHRAAHDPLTGLLNRGELQAQLVRALDQQALVPVAVAFVDLDRFKPVNDEHGHLVGDELLKVVARTLEGEVRAGDALARPGGDEFVVLLRDASLSEALEVADRIRYRLGEPVSLEGVPGPLRISASIGVAVAHPDDTASSLLHAADLAVYEAKRRGRDRVEVSTRMLREAGAAVDDLLDDVARAGGPRPEGRWSAEVAAEEPEGPLPG